VGEGSGVKPAEASVSAAAPSALAEGAPKVPEASSEGQKPVLKTVLKPVLKPVGTPPPGARPAGEGAAAVGTGRPTFGLRPKGDTGLLVAGAAKAAAAAIVAEPKPAVATAAEKGVVERDAEGSVAVRPKVDQRALYYQLMNGLYDAVLVLDDQGHVVDCNSRVAEMLGYTREEAWDLPIGKVITGMVSQMFEHLKRNLAENNHVLIDARCFRKDGSSFAGEVGVSTLSLTRGNNMVFAIRNVERRKSAMDDLRKSQAALDIALAPTFVCDTDGFFVVVNQTLLDAFGIPDADQAKGVRFMDLLPDAARLFLRASCGEKVHETLNVPTPDGQPVKLQLALMPVQTGQSVTGVAGSILQM
jgi:PAS domain S-box-containing protein